MGVVQSVDFRAAMGRSKQCAVFRYWMFSREMVITNSVSLYLKPLKKLSSPFYLPKFINYREARPGLTRCVLNCQGEDLHSVGLNLE